MDLFLLLLRRDGHLGRLGYSLPLSSGSKRFWAPGASSFDGFRARKHVFFEKKDKLQLTDEVTVPKVFLVAPFLLQS